MSAETILFVNAQESGIFMNAVVVGVITMLVLSMVRVNVVLAVFIGAILAGLSSGLGITDTMTAFTQGLGGGAGIALSYVLLGAFATSLAYSGVPEWLVTNAAKKLMSDSNRVGVKARLSLLLGTLVVAIASQNIIPVHIAFIPILIPPLLTTFGFLKLDRRAVACVLTFGLCATYLVVPFGFGDIYLNQILAGNLEANGVVVDHALMPKAMAIPVLGMFVGMLWALFFSYRKPRAYAFIEHKEEGVETHKITKKTFIIVTVAVVLALITQIKTGSILLSSVVGFFILVIAAVVPWRTADSVFIEGMKTMAFAAFVMMAASGFAEVLRQTGDIVSLIGSAATLFGDSKPFASLMMLVIGLLITMGIGSSFSTIPIIAAIFVPLATQMGFSPIAIVALVGTAGALGDAGSPASESAIGPTMGLSTDGQHDHIRDTVIPTFLHFNIPMIAFGWVATMIL